VTTAEPTVTVYRSLAEAEETLRLLARYAEPWTFDIETYDGGETHDRYEGKRGKDFVLPPDDQVPSRKHVSVDPHHPHFRVRGVAIALSADAGYWIELNGDPRGLGRRLTPRGAREVSPTAMDALAEAFGSDAEKGAYNGHFDENGLVFTGWVPRVTNRVRDGMLSAIALGDSTHENLRLPTLIVSLLGRKTYWDVDKAWMRDLPIADVARGAVFDACYTHELCDHLDARAAADPPTYIRWRMLDKDPARPAPPSDAEIPEDDYV